MMGVECRRNVESLMEVTDMFRNEVCRRTGLTKKAVEYYTRKGMVVPALLGNGYRDYKEEDVEVLRRIGVLRRFGIGMEEIGEILRDGSGEAFRKAALRREMERRRNGRKDVLFWELCEGRDFWEIEEELRALEVEETVGERLIDAFPGYYGRVVCVHFLSFLDEPVRTEEQREAYETVLEFLDNMPAFEVPEDVEDVMEDVIGEMGAEQVEKMFDAVKRSVEEPEDFFAENGETIAWYLAYRQSEEYRESAAGKWMACMRQFQEASGYTEVFLPAMRRLSPSYEEYCRRMEEANQRFLERYPEAEAIFGVSS